MNNIHLGLLPVHLLLITTWCLTIITSRMMLPFTSKRIFGKQIKVSSYGKPWSVHRPSILSWVCQDCKKNTILSWRKWTSQNARQVQRLEKVKNRSFLACLKEKKTCRKKPLWTDQGNIGCCSFSFPQWLEVGFVFVFVFDWKLGLGLWCNLSCHSTVRVCQGFKWQTYFLSHAMLYFENIEECNEVIVFS